MLMEGLKVKFGVFLIVFHMQRVFENFQCHIHFVLSPSILQLTGKGYSSNWIIFRRNNKYRNLRQVVIKFLNGVSEMNLKSCVKFQINRQQSFYNRLHKFVFKE